MKAAVWYGKKDVRVMDVPEPPAPGAGQVKVKVHWCGICGSDLHEYLAGPIFIPATEPHPLTGSTAPLILGHEFAGEIVEVGPGVTNVKVGDRVAPDACQACWECYYCKRNLYNLCEKLAFTGLMTNGAFAEYVNVPAYTLYKLPETVSYESLAYNGEFATAIDLLGDGRLDAEPLITGKINIDDIVEKGFEELVNRKEENIKILVTPW